jgi:Domain of unknown function (DUF5919)
MTGQPTLLAALLEDRGWQRYGTFRAAYEKAARSLDRQHGSSAPSRAQFHRWLTGDLRGLPYTDHCRVLEHMLAGYSVAQLFKPCPNDIPPPARISATASPSPSEPPRLISATGTADIAAVFASRSDFAAKIESQALLDGATRIRAAGLSLNLICQQLPDQQLLRLLGGGTELSCLFLDPAGEAMAFREREEEYAPGFLASLTSFNIQVLCRLRDRLPADAHDRVRLAVYDETIRFNILLVDDDTCVVQPYLPHARGIDSPTLMLRRDDKPGGMYPIFEQVYEAIAERSRQL